MPPEHAANLVANSGNTANGVGNVYHCTGHFERIYRNCLDCLWWPLNDFTGSIDFCWFSVVAYSNRLKLYMSILSLSPRETSLHAWVHVVPYLVDAFQVRFHWQITHKKWVADLGSPDSKVRGANMGPIWVLSAPDGPLVGPMSFAIWGSFSQSVITQIGQSCHIIPVLLIGQLLWTKISTSWKRTFQHLCHKYFQRCTCKICQSCFLSGYILITSIFCGMWPSPGNTSTNL